MILVSPTLRRLRDALLALAVLCSFFSVVQAGFLSGSNLLNIAIQVGLAGLIGIGSTFAVITGGLDLSVGGTAALAGIVFIRMLDLGIWPAGACALVSGAVVGISNGLLIGRFGYNPIIVTLGALSWTQGLALLFSHGFPLAGPSGSFEMLGGGFLLYVPLPIVFFSLTAISAAFFLHRIQIGRDLYAIGSNREAAVLCGIPVRARLQFTYLVSSMLAAFSGMILASRLNTASPIVGQEAPLEALVAIVIGGTPLSGGAGGILNTLIGLFVLEVLTNGLNLLNVSPASRWGITGIMLILFAALDPSRFRSKFSPEAA